MTLRSRVLALIPLLVLAGVALGAARDTRPTDADRNRPFRTAIFDPELMTRPGLQVIALRRIRASGATIVRLVVSWRDVAPVGVGGNRPPRFDADDPGEPRYRWARVDQQVKRAKAARLEPLLDIINAPLWAQPLRPYDYSSYKPIPDELAHFAMAAARRYSGVYHGLPRVRYWQVWMSRTSTST